jgi:predicted membrane protein
MIVLAALICFIIQCSYSKEISFWPLATIFVGLLVALTATRFDNNNIKWYVKNDLLTSSVFPRLAYRFSAVSTLKTC